MTALVDCRFDSLRNQKFIGTVNDMLLQWLQSNGATSNSLPDAWRQVLDLQLGAAATGHYNDDWHAVLGNLGYTGTINDRETAFWCAGGTLGFFIYEDPNRVDALAGLPEGDECRVLVITIDDPAVTPVTFTCNGVTQTGVIGAPGVNEFQLFPTGTDKSDVDQVCWTGAAVVTGLSGFTRYPWTVAQGANSNEGSFYNSPGPDDDWRFVFANCDVMYISAGYNGNNDPTQAQIDFEAAAPYFVHGIWPQYRRIAQGGGPPVTVQFYVDDYAYYERSFVQDQDGNTGFFHFVQPDVLRDTGREYDYALAIICALGFCGHVDSSLDMGYLLWGRQVDRAWMRRNTSFAFQWGDHEFRDDFGFELPTSDDPNRTHMHDTYTTGVGNYDGAAKTMFEAFFGRIRPSLKNVAARRDTDTVHWATQYGPVTFGAYDGITRGSGGMEFFQPPAKGTIMGADQINDLREALTSHTSDITILGSPVGMRYILDDQDYPPQLIGNNGGDQHALWDHTVGEYQSLFTDTTQASPPSLMASPRTNGTQGNLVVFHGDYHREHVYRLDKPQYTNNAQELFYYFGAGTTNGMTNMGITAPINEAASNVNIVMPTDWGYSEHNYAGAWGEVRGSALSTALDVTMIDEDGSTNWRGSMITGRTNYFATVAPDSPTGLVVTNGVAGPELILNGAFETDLTDWVSRGDVTAASVAGQAQVMNVSGTDARITQNTGVVGGNYTLTYDVISIVDNGGRVRVSYRNDGANDAGNTAAENAHAVGTSGAFSLTYDIPADESGHTVALVAFFTGGTCTYDNVSVKENLQGATLTWSHVDTKDGAVEQYDIYRVESVSQPVSWGSPIGVAGPGDRVYSDTTVTGGNWWYKVVAANALGNGDDGTNNVASIILPHPPINYQSSFFTLGPEVIITWEDNPANANPATEYTITRDNQPDVVITAPTDTYADLRDLTPGETYTWFITLTNADGTSNKISTSTEIPIS